MRLDIIVPHYHEPWDVCKYLFDSINLQRMVDFKNIRVLMINDGEDVILDYEVMKKYPFEVQYIVRPHGGVSATRNFGLEWSDADYVMFCDADDGFLTNFALYMIKLEAAKGYDIINPVFIEECMNFVTNEKFLETHEHDATFLHGKAYRREFLIEKKVHFPHDLNLHEDGFFNALAVCSGQDNIVEVNAPIYLWRWNDNSVVRKENDFTLRTYDKLCECWRQTLAWLKENGYENEYKHVVAKTVISTFYNFQTTPYMVARNEKYRKNAEKAFKKLYLEIQKDFLKCDDRLIGKMSEIIREDARKAGFEYERIDLKSWIRHIEYEV